MHKTHNFYITSLGWLLLTLLLASCDLLPPPAANGDVLAPDAPQLPDAFSETAVVTEIIDGDTINVTIDGRSYRVRYIGIDTPERDEACYTEATNANAAWVEGQTVRLVQDVSQTDRFDRLLRYVYVGDVLVNAELVAGGWAESKRYPPDDELYPYLEDLEATAAEQQLGCYPTGVFAP
ncbi:MAG: thermonuclease family protein [Chloroflexota bacterium]